MAAPTSNICGRGTRDSEASSDCRLESSTCAQDFLLKSVCYLLITVVLFLLSCLGHYTVPVPYPQTLHPQHRPPRLQAHSAAVQLGGKEVCGKGRPEALGGVADHGLAQALL